MSCVGRPPEMRGSVGSPRCRTRRGAGGAERRRVLAALVVDHANRTSNSDVLFGTIVAPSASCLLRA